MIEAKAETTTTATATASTPSASTTRTSIPTTTETTSTPPFKTGFIALCGVPNAGKSSLLNSLVEGRIAAVSSKPQTTRRKIEGFVSHNQSQVVAVDIPGVVDPDTNLNTALYQQFERAMMDVDGVLMLLPSDGLNSRRELREIVQKYKKPFRVLVTKSDLLSQKDREETKEKLEEEFGFPVFFVSTRTRDFSARDLKRVFMEACAPLLCPSHDQLFEDDAFTTQTLRDITSELVLEQCFERLSQELPYNMAVKVRKFEESDTIYRIFADLIVAKESQKAIVIGKGGAMIRAIGEASRKELEKICGVAIYLELNVVVEKNWMNNKRVLSELGLSCRELAKSPS